MKFLPSILFSILCTGLFAQSGTTLEEYRYLSKGYIYQLEMGLDARKEGYSVEKIFKTVDGDELIGLYKNSEPTPKALLILLASDEEQDSYICIPNNQADKKVNQLASQDYEKLSAKNKTRYHQALNRFLFSSLSTHKNSDLAQSELQPAAFDPAPTIKEETLTRKSVPVKKEVIEAENRQQTGSSDEFSKAKDPLNTSPGKISDMNVGGEISTREVVQSESAVNHSQKRGVVTIKVCVDDEGTVTMAKFTQRGSTTFDAYLKDIALKAAKSVKFVPADTFEECGTIQYKF